MAVTDYDSLKSEIITWSHRDDVDLLIDTFIDIAEQEMLANDSEPLKVRGQESTATDTLSTSARTLALPTRYNQYRSMRVQATTGGACDIKYRAPDQMAIQPTSGLPRFFTVTDRIEFDRVPDSDYTIEFSYYEDPVSLDSINTTNNVLTQYPNIYLFGTLWALFTWATDEQEASKYYNLFIRAIKGANRKDKSGRYGPAPVQRIEGSTP